MDPPRHKERELEDKDRRDIMVELLTRRNVSATHQLPPGAFAEVARQFGVGRATIRKHWLRNVRCREENRLVTPEVLSRKTERPPPPKYPAEHLLENIPHIPLSLRKTNRSLAHQLGVSVNVVERAHKAGIFRRHSSTLKSVLSPLQEVTRLNYCLEQRNVTGLAFNDQLDTIHVDEKWFPITKKSQNFFLGRNEPNPVRKHHNYQHVEKVSLVVALLLLLLLFLSYCLFVLLLHHHLTTTKGFVFVRNCQATIRLGEERAMGW